MDVILKYLKEEGHNISDDLVSFRENQIDVWNGWWKGHVDDVHDFKQRGVDGKLHSFTRKKLFMGKKVAEDWASLLLNDKTYITVDDKTTQKFLTGDGESQDGGVLEKNNFWQQANKLIEKESATGTVAFLIGIEGATIYDDGSIEGGKLTIRYISDSKKIIPLSWKNGEITECAFVSKKRNGNKDYTYIERHLKTDEGYFIKNNFFEIKDDKLVEVFDVFSSVNREINSLTKLFYISTPTIENNFTDIPMGASRFANAIDCLETCDLSFDNFANDMLLGGKKMFVDETMLETDTEGKPKAVGTVEKRLYSKRRSADDPSQKDGKLIDEYNPSLRTDENEKAIQLSLNLLSSKVGFGQHRYSFDSKGFTTATEYKGSNKDLQDSVQKQRMGLATTLTDLIKGILYLAKNQLGENVNPEAKIMIEFDDTVFRDEETERQRFMQEISQGLRQSWEYRVKYLNEDESTAKAMTTSKDFYFKE